MFIRKYYHYHCPFQQDCQHYWANGNFPKPTNWFIQVIIGKCINVLRNVHESDYFSPVPLNLRRNIHIYNTHAYTNTQIQMYIYLHLHHLHLNLFSRVTIKPENTEGPSNETSHIDINEKLPLAPALSVVVFHRTTKQYELRYWTVLLFRVICCSE